jgi:uncharacterized protein YdeI (YjbR/CyaY-like superfamily)
VKSTYHPKNREAWRVWLKKHHRTASEIWCLFSKKHAATPSVSYDDAVEEALCFGWIDGVVRTIDADCYAQRFSPRKPGSSWSPSNIKRMKKMIVAGKVEPAGRAAFAGHQRRRTTPRPTKLPAALERHFRSDLRAWCNFQKFPAGYQRMTIGWVASAKQDRTRRRRLDQLITKSAHNERIKFI